MTSEIVLDPEETVAGRPFTDPEHTQRDEKALQSLLTQERERASVWAGGSTPHEKGVIIHDRDPEGHRHLLVVPDTRALLETRDPTIVGFFGRPRTDVDRGILFDLEEELIGGMEGYAEHGLLSYYDVELVKGSYGNLILFATPDGPGSWAENPIHQHAVDISPANYHEIRLHQGTLTGALLDGGLLRVSRTRYLDYSGPDVWRAIRPVIRPSG